MSDKEQRGHWLEHREQGGAEASIHRPLEGCGGCRRAVTGSGLRRHCGEKGGMQEIIGGHCERWRWLDPGGERKNGQILDMVARAELTRFASGHETEQFEA